MKSTRDLAGLNLNAPEFIPKISMDLMQMKITSETRLDSKSSSFKDVKSKIKKYYFRLSELHEEY